MGSVWMVAVDVMGYLPLVVNFRHSFSYSKRVPASAVTQKGH